MSRISFHRTTFGAFVYEVSVPLKAFIFKRQNDDIFEGSTFA